MCALQKPFLKWSCIVLGATILMSACATKQQVQPTMLEPEIPVFRYEQYVHNEGLRGKFAFDAQDVIIVTPDRKRTDTTFQWTGAILGRLIGKQENAEIVRLDKDIIWQVNKKKKRYYEYPIKQAVSEAGGKQETYESQPEVMPENIKVEYDDVYVEDCIKCTSNSGIKRPGLKKPVNGYDSEQVILSLNTTCENLETGQKRSTTYTLETWLAPDAKLGSEIDAFNQAYAKKLGLDITLLQAAGADLVKAFPQVKDLALMMADMKGYPVLNTLTIEDDEYLKRVEEERKKEAEKEAQKEAPKSPADMLTGFLGKKLNERMDAKKREEDEKWGNVIWRVSWGGKNFSKMHLTASDFNAPDGFKKVENKLALEDKHEKAEASSTASAGNAPSRTSETAYNSETDNKPLRITRYNRTACLSTLGEADIVTAIYPGSRISRGKPYDYEDHNTKWYYKDRYDYMLQYTTSEPMEKVVAFYGNKFKTQCRTEMRKVGDIEYKEYVCSQANGTGKTRTFRMDERPLEISRMAEEENATGRIRSEGQKVFAFELGTGK